MSQVYTGRVRVCHHELDAFGRVYPAAYLRHLAATAVDASTAAGFDARWYAANGVHWLVRRTTLDVVAPATVGTDLEVRTWVESFRRVRSSRRYEVRTPDGAPILDAVTDWVLVETASGKLRRVPAEMEARFGAAGGEPSAVRAPWPVPHAPARPLRTPYAVRYTDLDALVHVNNATYLDVLTHAGLDALAQLAWPLERLLGAGVSPLCARADVEYVDMARFGDPLVVETWLTSTADTLGVQQRLVRDDDGRAVVRATQTWRWLEPAGDASAPTPPDLVQAVGEACAA